MGLISAIIIAAVVMVYSLLAIINGISPAIAVRSIIGLAVIIFNVAAYLKLKDNPKYVHCCCSSMIVLFITVLATGRSISEYAVAYSIAILVLNFSDFRLAVAGSVTAMIGVVIYSVYLGVSGTAKSDDVVLVILFTLAACIICAMVCKNLTSQTRESLEEVKNAADEQNRTSEEIINLANSLNQKFVSAKEVSDALNDSMNTSNSSVSEIAPSTKVNAEAIEQQTNQTSDIQNSIQSVGEEASRMEEISETTKTTVDEGVVLIEKLKEQAAQVARINTETKETTEQLNISIQDVQDITETILGISSQTNLLALNASIEAARAGEAGKGFAVVADEIRNLSEDTRKATEQISAIIERLTKDAELASASMAQSAEYAQKQNELIDETGTRLMDSIQNLSATSQEVAASSDRALSISDTAMDALANMNSLLGDISQISTSMEHVVNKE